MKNKSLIISLLFAVTLLFVLASAFMPGGKKGFKGSVIYAITYEGEELTPAQKAYMPKKQEIKIMGNITKEINDYGQSAQYTISNPESDSYITLMDMGEKKIYVKQSLKEQLRKADSVLEANIEVTTDLLNETKIIAGYTCKKAMITLTPKDTAEGEPQTIMVYYCPELGGKELNQGNVFYDIDGLMLEYQIDAGDFKVKFSATEVKKGGVSITDFLIPDEFKELTLEEFKKQFGGGGSESDE